MDREVVEQIPKSKRKERQEKQVRKTFTSLIATKKLVEKELVKQQQANFIATWSPSIVKEARDRFHSNFKVGLQAHPLGYMGVNLRLIT